MKCLIFEQMMAYLDGEVPLQERQQMDSHLAACSACRMAVESCMSDFAAYDALGDAPPLPDSFTNEIMEAISSKAAENKTEPKLKTIDLILNTCWRGSMKKKMVVTAAGLALAISIGAYTSPTFASYVQSLLNLQAETKDQDIVFKVKRAVINPKVISLEMEFIKDGKHLPLDVPGEAFSFNIVSGSSEHQFHKYNLENSNKNDVYVTDEKGNRIIDRSKVSYSGIHPQIDSIPISILNISLDDETFEKLPEQVIVHFDLNRVDGKPGKWHLTAPINVKELKQKSNLVVLNKTYQTPGRPAFHLIGWQSINAISQIITSIDGRGNYGYQVKNKKGEVVAAKDPSRVQNKNLIASGDENEILGHAGTQFKRFEEDEDLTFELTAYYWSESLQQMITIDPQAVSRMPQVIDLGEGKTLKITKVELKTDDSFRPLPRNTVKKVFGETEPYQDMRTSAKGVYLEMEGILDKETVELFDWNIKVNNQDWKSFDYTRREQDENGNYKFRKVIHIEDLDKMPETITLENPDVLKKNTSIDWKVPLGKPMPE